MRSQIFLTYRYFSHMSFGRPPSINVGFTPSPPDRGSFPLDHYGLWFFVWVWLSCSNTRLGECKATMTMYMECLKENSNNSTPCRALSRDYLDCRMKKWVRHAFFHNDTPSPQKKSSSLSRGLMERDDWRNLGMQNVDNKMENTTDKVKKAT